MTSQVCGIWSEETDALGNETELTYQSDGKLMGITDSIGTVQALTYDKNGNPVSMADGNGNITRYNYNSEGQCVGVTVRRTDADGTQRDYTSVYTYDSAGNISTVTGDYEPTMEEVSGLQLKYFIERAWWEEYDFDTMTKLEEPYLEKRICSGFDLYSDDQLGDKELNEYKVIGNDGTQSEEYDAFRNEHPELIVLTPQIGMRLLFTFANYDGLKYDPVLDGR